MKFKRCSGILLHPTCLPGAYGIGDFGTAAYRWVDFLEGAGCRLWQVLPLGPTGYGDSPYQCFSAFAGNPYLISPESLLDEGLIQPDDLGNKPDFPAGHVNYGELIPWKLDLLHKSFQHFSAGEPDGRPPAFGPLHKAFDLFCSEQAAWLDDYALFMAIKEAHGGGSWEGWPGALRRREEAATADFRNRNAPAIGRYKFYQFIFFRQWDALHAYARQKGVEIIGDLPIFVAFDSADVWAHPELFFLDAERKPTVVAGVPPDYFSPTGQLWGNPLYNWEVHKQTGYAWWLERIHSVLKLVDILRIDHFRGFAANWEIPAGNPTAETGRWATGPGADLFTAVQTSRGNDPVGSAADLPIIAEDLGVITPDVVTLREQFGLPGMKILQFAFSAPDNPFLPHRYPRNCAVYTGTHDNDTTRGWYLSAPEGEKNFARRYLGISKTEATESSFAWSLIRAAWASVAVFALAPMQDFLDLGTEARMNYPSRLGGNWEWRLEADALSDELREKIKDLNWMYER